MKSLRQCIKEAEEKGVAIGHFNISDLEQLRAIFNVAKRLNVPVIIGVSEGERDFVGVNQAQALVKSLREEHDFPIFLNADHTYSLEKVKEAVDAGFDAVIVDGAKLSLEENITLTKQAVEYARSKNPEIIVEGELGYIGTSSKLLDEIPEGVKIGREFFTKPDEAERFVKETGVDLFAPAVGNIRGMLKGSPDPHLDIELVKEIREKCGVPLVLHGGSGTPDEDFVSAIKNGVAIVHINTEIRVAYKEGLKDALEQNPDEIAPYKYLKVAIEEVEQAVEKRLKLFNGME
jgi:fructose-bisphosphate aldolase class II